MAFGWWCHIRHEYTWSLYNSYTIDLLVSQPPKFICRFPHSMMENVQSLDARLAPPKMEMDTPWPTSSSSSHEPKAILILEQGIWSIGG